jgi:hypothetical protein
VSLRFDAVDGDVGVGYEVLDLGLVDVDVAVTKEEDEVAFVLEGSEAVDESCVVVRNGVVVSEVEVDNCNRGGANVAGEDRELEVG